MFFAATKQCSAQSPAQSREDYKDHQCSDHGHAEQQDDALRRLEKFHDLVGLRVWIARRGLLDSSDQILADAVPSVKQQGADREHDGKKTATQNAGNHAEAGSHPRSDAGRRDPAPVKDYRQAAADQHPQSEAGKRSNHEQGCDQTGQGRSRPRL